MRQKVFSWWFILLSSLLLCACAREDVEPAVSIAELAEVTTVNDIQLAFGTTIAAQEEATTRMSRTNTQADGQFRGIDYLRFIPFSQEREIRKGDTSLKSDVGFFKMEGYQDPVNTQYLEVGTYYDKYTVSNSLYYASKVPVNTRSFLLYAHPSGGGVGDKTSANKFAMGSLQVSDAMGNTGNVDASSITFEPDQIYRESPADNTPYKTDKTTYDNAKQYAQKMVEFMNALAQTEYTDGVKWYEAPAASTAKTLFDQFTHNGLTFTLGNDQLPTILTNLYGNSNMPATLKTAMETLVADKYKNYLSHNGGTFSAKGNWSGFPKTGSLPNGLFVFKWIDETHQFVLMTADNTSMNVAANVSAGTALTPQIMNPEPFAFPAQLWYYGNSTIHTRNSELTDAEINDIITGQNGVTPWTSISFDDYFDKTVVETDTQSAVIDYPMNYGVARLEINAKMTSAPLNYTQPGGAGTYSIPADAIQFKGIMVCDQHKTGFDFQPVDYAFNVLYDNNIKNNRPNPADFTLSTKIWDRNKVNILTLPSYPQEEIYLIAEFYIQKDKLAGNQTTKPIRTATNCEIYPNTCFYMVAKLDPTPTSLSESNLNGNVRQVFISDKCTKVQLILSSLDGAYNYVPDVRTPSLTLGLEVVFDWQQADPTTIWLNDDE